MGHFDCRGLTTTTNMKRKILIYDCVNGKIKRSAKLNIAIKHHRHKEMLAWNNSSSDALHD